MFARDGRRLLVRVEVAARRPVLEADQVAVAHQLDGIARVPAGRRLVELFDEPPVVAVLVRVGRDLRPSDQEIITIISPQVENGKKKNS